MKKEIRFKEYIKENPKKYLGSVGIPEQYFDYLINNTFTVVKLWEFTRYYLIRVNKNYLLGGLVDMGQMEFDVPCHYLEFK